NLLTMAGVATFSPQPVNGYAFILYFGFMLMIGPLMTQMMMLLTITIRRERERTRELRSSQKTILDQQQVLINSSKMSALGEMAGGVAHEVNTPLAILLLLANQIRKGIEQSPLDTETLKTKAQMLEHTVDRIARIIRALRSFSRNGSVDPYRPIEL